ncbi:hypothetical protein LUZ63_014456 [Rhynchospora breviuscula]|uniref:BED-type domain-containing protein n=1 Tax=Rhynchospora breviuscula TaxID=2022672 RepID=A0A9Q0CAF8_9POAL|nr:hypothetical protein LUZ63_014456 [Rhynchospora breviuscula]
MGAGLHMETPDEIQQIQNDAQAQSQSCPEGPEQTNNKRRTKETLKAAVWAHFKRGQVQEDGSYTATCNYCGHVYPMGNQRGTGNMRHHIKRGCKKMPSTKRHKPDALQKLLQAGRDEAGQATVASWVFDQRKCRISFAKCVIAHEYPFNCANHHFLKVDAPNKKPAWDVETRWNSTYLMLDLALQLKQAINRYALSDNNFNMCPNDVDWEHVEALICHLKVFYDVTNKLSGTKYTTLNIFFPEYCEVYLTIKKMSQSAYPFVVDMSKEMFYKWNKYWKVASILLAIGCVLDPRCKLDVVEYYFRMMHPEECPGFMDNLRTCLNKLFNEYLLAHSKGSENQPSSSTIHMSSTTSSDGMSDTRAELKSFLSSKRAVDPTKTEMQEYLCAGLDPTSLDAEFDILAWWKMNAAKYPILARLTRDILAVPISTVASESTFKNGGIFGDVIWSSDGALSNDDTICGSAAKGT